jgi:enoyl-CoA hydratase/carnithine racemase
MRVESVLETFKGGILWLTLNRPEVRNALDEALVVTLRDRVRQADSDPKTRVVVLRGAGASFCSGGDLDSFLEQHGARQIRDYIRRFFELFSAIELCSKPVVAAVHGAALAGGMELCLAADLVVAASDAVFGTPEPRLGLSPGFADVRLVQVVGLHNAKRLILTGDRIDAAEAWRLGIVNVVCPPEKLEDEARAVAERLGANAPLALAAGKAMLNRHARDGYEHTMEMVTMLQMTADLKEGIAAFKEKREPRFQGL